MCNKECKNDQLIESLQDELTELYESMLATDKTLGALTFHIIGMYILLIVESIIFAIYLAVH